jgi:hypothetical protein
MSEIYLQSESVSVNSGARLFVGTLVNTGPGMARLYRVLPESLLYLVAVSGGVKRSTLSMVYCFKIRDFSRRNRFLKLTQCVTHQEAFQFFFVLHFAQKVSRSNAGD